MTSWMLPCSHSTTNQHLCCCCCNKKNGRSSAQFMARFCSPVSVYTLCGLLLYYISLLFFFFASFHSLQVPSIGTGNSAKISKCCASLFQAGDKVDDDAHDDETVLRNSAGKRRKKKRENMRGEKDGLVWGATRRRQEEDKIHKQRKERQ